MRNGQSGVQWKVTLAALMLLLGLTACESENEHFCSKYSFYHAEITAEDSMPLGDIKTLLEQKLAKRPDSDPDKMALLVVKDIEREFIREGEEPRAYCLRRERWKGYR